jgi:uncharacterized membrane protein YfcA
MASRRVVAVALTFLSLVVAVHGTSTSDDGDDRKDVVDMGVTDVLGLLFMAFGLAISSAGGIGGGSILVPALVLMLDFDMKRATPVSTLAVGGGAIANAWFNLRKRHPKADRPLIDSDMAAVIIPVVMGGAVLGAILSNLLPTYIISLLFVIVLAVSGWRAVQKAMQLRRREAAVAVADDSHEALVRGIDDSSNDSGSNCAAVDAKPVTSPSNCSPHTSFHVVLDGGDGDQIPTFDASDDDLQLAALIESERHLSWRRQLSILVCYLGILLASVLGKLVTCGGFAYWALLVVEIPWVAAFATGTARSLNQQYVLKQKLGYTFADGDVCWDARTARMMPVGCLLAGVVAGLFGIGGAIIASPLMLEMGVVPEVAAATSALMVLYSSAAAMLKYVMFGMVAWDWAALLFVLALVVTSVSQVVILGYVRRSGRQSIIVLCVGASILLGAALMAVRAVRSAIDDAGEPFNPHICT